VKPIDQEYMEDLKDLARESLREIRAMFAYQGSDSRYFQKGKAAIGVIGVYKGMVAAENNRTALEHMVKGGAKPPQLEKGDR
jgi:hypothetical protein